ncbi:MAG: acylneuraminate cytidylyltransferase [Actinomycetota bacterium]|nr:acylneuraminate cytidylyltransferase [Actinomycetota bacterium]
MSQTIADADVAAFPMRTARVCAVIPARGGSKGVPGKNLRRIGGEPIIVRAIHTLQAVDNVDVVLVSTDDDEIAERAQAAGALVIRRPHELAGDLASSESALLHALGQLAERDALPQVTVFVQATSPFIEPDDIADAIDLVLADECDVAFSVTRAETHLWRQGARGPEGVNHDPAIRQRRQDRPLEFQETGAFYVLNTQGFVEAGHRFFGRLRLVEVDAADAIEIDTEDDLRLATVLSAQRGEPNVQPVGAKAVVTDFDGVHTNDRATIDESGVEAVTVNRSDGMGVAHLRRAGVPMLILSSETNRVVRMRAKKLGVDVITGCDDKLTALSSWADEQGIALADVAYLGNDINDLDCLEAVGWPVVVADAHPVVRGAGRIVLRRRGGEGAVRELADRVLAGITSPPHVVHNGRK